ncbi:MAG: DUF1493 family protein [Pseudomonadota bacterium]
MNDQVRALIREYTGVRGDIAEDADLLADLGIDGDDFVELMDLYSDRFSVSMDRYLWRFHHSEEGVGAGGPALALGRIAVTPLMLAEYAKCGEWRLEYPDHQTPGRRWDMIGSWAALALILAAFIYWEIFIR